ncbi:MAG: hypothetical protein IJ870_03500 [Alphaproteobacteria bacterium]|nr:hypothetical protein [Alphaproteobacteria bacterium]
MQLKTIVCSGVNEKNDVSQAIQFLKQYPNVEFGVQCSPKKAGFGTKRYTWLKELCSRLDEQRIKGRVALHLNEGFVTTFCEGKVPDGLAELLKESKAVGRLQLNFKIGREVFGTKKVPDIHLLSKAIDEVQGHQVIVSASEANLVYIKKMYYQGLKFDVLFDDSFGEGILPDTRKKPLFDDVLQGYAGGISPENVAGELEKIAKVASGNVFIDAEGKLKEDGAFSFEKAAEYVKNAMNWQQFQGLRQFQAKSVQEK